MSGSSRFMDASRLSAARLIPPELHDWWTANEEAGLASSQREINFEEDASSGVYEFRNHWNCNRSGRKQLWTVRSPVQEKYYTTEGEHGQQRRRSNLKQTIQICTETVEQTNRRKEDLQMSEIPTRTTQARNLSNRIRRPANKVRFEWLRNAKEGRRTNDDESWRWPTPGRTIVRFFKVDRENFLHKVVGCFPTNDF